MRQALCFIPQPHHIQRLIQVSDFRFFVHNIHFDVLIER